MRPRIRINFNKSVETVSGNSPAASSLINVSNAQDIFDASKEVANVKGLQLSDDTHSAVSTLSGDYGFYGDEGYSGASFKFGNSSITRILLQASESATIFIIFDTVSGEYAKKISLGSTVLVSNNSSTICKVTLPAFSTNTYLIFEDWSNPEHNIKVTKILKQPNWVFDASSIISFRCSENFMSSDLALSPGICEQFADVVLYDRDGYIHQLAEGGLLNEDIQLVIEGVDNNSVVQLGTYVVADWDVYSNDDRVSLTCRDLSYLFENLQVQVSTVQNRTLHDILAELFNIKNFVWRYIDDTTRTRCRNISVPNCFYSSNNLKNLINQACSLGMLRIYYYNDVFVVGRCE